MENNIDAKSNSNEEWIDIPGYGGMYQISNLGRARSWKNNRWGRLEEPIYRKHVIRNGYPSVSLCKGGECRYFYIHRLIAAAFIPNPNGKECINHKDGDKLNSRASNLEWCSRAENNSHAQRHALTAVGEKNRQAKLCRNDVLEIRKTHSGGQATFKETADTFNVTPQTISRIVSRETWSHI